MDRKRDMLRYLIRIARNERSNVWPNYRILMNVAEEHPLNLGTSQSVPPVLNILCPSIPTL